MNSRAADLRVFKGSSRNKVNKEMQYTLAKRT
jgi:hypothetical protein